MNTTHEFTSHNTGSGSSDYCGPWNHDSYKGEYSIEARPEAAVKIRRRAIGACSVIHAKAVTGQSFRRSAADIREDSADVVVFCFVRTGLLQLTHAQGQATAQAGHVLATRSISPFDIRCSVNGAAKYEALHLIVPTHMMRRHLRRDIAIAFSPSLAGQEIAISERVLMELIDAGSGVSESAGGLLIDAILAILADAIKAEVPDDLFKPTHATLQVRNVMRHIELHISNPTLSVTSVAKACGVSPRYIFSIFQKQGTTFATVVWRRRLDMAASWLARSNAGDASIKEIAIRTGFKSGAHFTRMFKREFREPPKSFRLAAGRAEVALADAKRIGESRSKH